jgi:hypothetical protein
MEKNNFNDPEMGYGQPVMYAPPEMQQQMYAPPVMQQQMF